MQLWPGEIFSIENDRTPEENMSRLAAMIQPYSSRTADPEGKPFFGWVEGNTFRIFPHIEYRNSFLPEIRGTCAATAQGSLVRVRMGVVTPVKVLFLCMVCLLAFFEGMLVKEFMVRRIAGFCWRFLRLCSL